MGSPQIANATAKNAASSDEPQYQTARFTVHDDALDLLVSRVQTAIQKKEGLFHHGLEPLLPQYNMPPGLGIDRATRVCADPLNTAKYLWLRIQCDRRDPSYRVNAKMKRAWQLPQTNFLFHYEQVVHRSPKEISELFVNEVRYGFLEKDSNRPNDEHITGLTLIKNAQLMLKKYGGDPRNIIHNVDTHKAWEDLQEFDYWGEGLASLYLNEMIDLEIVEPLNRDKFMPKIDIHKPRIVFNTNAATINEGFTDIFHGSLIDTLGPAYRDAAKRTGINMVEVDGGIWAIGANICTTNDYRRCKLLCPLVNYCHGNAKEGRRETIDPQADEKRNRSAGTLVIKNQDGTRYDNRKHKETTGDFFPTVHNLKPEPVITSKTQTSEIDTKNQDTIEQLNLF